MYSKCSDSQSSTTKSGINTQNIIIKDEAEQLKRTGKTVQEEIAAIKTDITTESAQSQSGKLENRFNKDDVQKELDFQREVTEKFGPNVAEAGSLLANKFGEEAKAKRHEAAIALEEAEKAKAENNNETNRALVKQARDNFETASREAKEWETGGSQRLIIDSALNVISTALAGRPAAEVVASGLSPAVNNQIKKATTDAKGNVNTALNLTAHALWGAVEAYAGNRNVAAGAAGAAGGEVAAHFLASTLYNKSPEKLSEEEKRTVSSLSQVAAGIAGGSLSDSSDGAIIAAKTAKDAVDNNALVPIFGNVEPEIVQRAQGETKLAEMKADIDKMMREEQPIIMQTADDLYAIMSKTGKVIYVTREVVLEVAPVLISGPIGGALRAGKAIKFVATQPRIVALSEKAVEGVTKAAGKAKELMSEGIYYSYNPTQAKVVQTAVQGIEHGLKPLTEITYKQYAQGVAMGATASAITQYVATGDIDANKTVRTGLLAPYLLNAPLGTSVLIGSVDTAVSTISDGKSHVNEQVKYAESTLGGYTMEKISPPVLKPVAPFIGVVVGEIINQVNDKLEAKERKK